MRNLFSFITGIGSGLFVLLVRAVLLFDRAVCRFWDLPCWSAAARLFRAVGARRPLCAAAVFLPAFVLPSALLLHGGTLVYANGKPLGLIEDENTLSAAVMGIEQSAASLSGAAYSLPVTLETRATLAPESRFLTEAALADALVDASGELDDLAVISVDGTRAAVCRTEEEAQTVLDRVKAQYTTDADRSADFVQEVRVDNVVAETALAGDLGAVYNTLAPKLDVATTRAVTYTEEIPFETVTRENDRLDQTYRATVQQGCEGTAVVTAEIRTLDGEEQARTIVERTVLSEATDEIVEVGTRNVGIGTGAFALPLQSYTFTSAFKWRWGRLHGGVDLAVPEGQPVYAADNGKVIVAEDSGNGYGKYIILDHQNGYKTLYGHNSALEVSVGDIVAKGECIARSGNTGNSTGPHLHFEIHVNDEKVDPQRYLTIV